MYKNILVSVDLKDRSKDIVTRAVDFAKANNAHLMIVYIFEAAYLEGGFEAYLYSGVDQATHGVNQEKLKELVDHAKSLGCENVVSKIITSTSVSGCINYELEENYDIDLIVMGHSARQGLSRAIGGHIPSTVVRNSKCDVFVVY